MEKCASFLDEVKLLMIESMSINVSLAIRSTPDHLSAPCARTQLHAPISETLYFMEQSTSWLHDKAVSVSSWIDGCVAVAEEVWKSDKM